MVSELQTLSRWELEEGGRVNPVWKTIVKMASPTIPLSMNSWIFWGSNVSMSTLVRSLCNGDATLTLP